MVFHICGDKLITQPYMRIGKTVSNEIYYLRTVVPTKLQDPSQIVISLMPTLMTMRLFEATGAHTSMKTWNLINFDRVVNCLVVNCCKLRFSAKR